MSIKVVVFDDDDEDRARFEDTLKRAGCEVLSFGHPDPRKEAVAIAAFGPQIAVVDSEFQVELDGLGTVRKLVEIVPNVKVVICSYFVDRPDKYNWVRAQYKDVPGVCAVVGKAPFPTGERLLTACGAW
jgi:DNA-binding NtrC family response regulator